MKKITHLLLLLVFTTMSVFASDPVKEVPCCPVVYESQEVELSYDVEKYSKFFEPAYFNEKTNALHFESMAKVLTVQVFNSNGEMEFVLPVMAKKVRLSKNIFESGNYRLSFQLEDQADQMITYVKIN